MHHIFNYMEHETRTDISNGIIFAISAIRHFMTSLDIQIITINN